MKKSTKNTTSKIKAKTDNDLGRFLSGNDEVTPKVRPKVQSEVKKKVEAQVLSQVDFSKQKLTELGFEIEVLPSGAKTNLYHNQRFTLNGLVAYPMRGRYLHTVHNSPERIYSFIKQIEIYD